jgi:hypothetical protein
MPLNKVFHDAILSWNDRASSINPSEVHFQPTLGATAAGMR